MSRTERAIYILKPRQRQALENKSNDLRRFKDIGDHSKADYYKGMIHGYLWALYEAGQITDTERKLLHIYYTDTHLITIGHKERTTD